MKSVMFLHLSNLKRCELFQTLEPQDHYHLNFFLKSIDYFVAFQTCAVVDFQGICQLLLKYKMES